MFYCGKEEPVTNNESLYQKGDGANELVIDASRGLSLNRYCFVNKGGKNSLFSTLITELIGQLGLKAFGVACWLVHLPTKSQLASRVIEKRYLKFGWKVELKDSHYLASKELGLDDIKSWPSLGVDSSSAGMFIITGRNLDAIFGLIDPSLSLFLAQTRYFAPERKFLTRLENKDAAIIYRLDDDSGNMGLVLVTTKHIDIKALGNSIDIGEIFEDGCAYKAFV